ncbi:MAG: acyl-CoA thioesterase [Spongiibacter sp.]|uniref:Acyl-CoA thioesterase n=1 Tax=Spongiibacter thalassae TaxID=2721624 RepID=A0ABX1GGY7_9GAMM|nr:acyl-CoA thioesterase [Spongiibacter thalassae]MDX1504121.1 acyl-CoA thioesterase [Spongiibacter sp.]NKI18221.1 acyl-CoA thioesterase [Spongiibacter thalassae]
MRDIDDAPRPIGELALQVIAMPADTNADGDIYGGWLLSQMDVAGGITAGRRAGGRIATVAVGGMAFLTPVNVGAVVTCYTEIVEIGRSSIRVNVEVWTTDIDEDESVKVTEGEFVYVAIDDNGRTRSVD